MDLMLGNWASKNLHGLEGAHLAQFGEVLELENPDLFKWLTGQAPVPPEVRAAHPAARRAPQSAPLRRGGRPRRRARAAHATPRRPPRAAPARQADSEVMQMLIGDLRTQMNEYTTVKSPKGSWEGKVWE